MTAKPKEILKNPANEAAAPNPVPAQAAPAAPVAPKQEDPNKVMVTTLGNLQNVIQMIRNGKYPDMTAGEVIDIVTQISRNCISFEDYVKQQKPK